MSTEATVFHFDGNVTEFPLFSYIFHNREGSGGKIDLMEGNCCGITVAGRVCGRHANAFKDFQEFTNKTFINKLAECMTMLHKYFKVNEARFNQEEKGETFF